jgi:transcriptional regulator with XRE-family HTH domain
MDLIRVGTAIRLIRIRRGWTQADLADRARVSTGFVSMIERGRSENASFARPRRVAEALDARLDFVLRWQGSDLDRLLNSRHSAMHEAVAVYFERLDGWERAPEVSIYGERGVIDILAWHVATGTLLVIELKTEIVDIQELIGKIDQKRRLASRIGRERGWQAGIVGLWVLVAESRTNRRRVSAHRRTLKAAFQSDGRSIEGWLRKPSGPISALSFLLNLNEPRLRTDCASRRRVRRPRRCTSGQSDLA